MSELIEQLRRDSPITRIKALDAARERDLSDEELDAIVELLDDHRHDDPWNWGYTYNDPTYHDGRVVHDEAYLVLSTRGDAAVRAICRALARVRSAQGALFRVLVAHRRELSREVVELSESLADSPTALLARWELARRDGGTSHLEEVVGHWESSNRVLRQAAWDEAERVGGHAVAVLALGVLERDSSDAAATLLEKLGPILTEPEQRRLCSALIEPWRVAKAHVRAIAAYPTRHAADTLLGFLRIPHDTPAGQDSHAQLEAAIQLAMREAHDDLVRRALDAAAEHDSKLAHIVKVARWHAARSGVDGS